MNFKQSVLQINLPSWLGLLVRLGVIFFVLILLGFGLLRRQGRGNYCPDNQSFIIQKVGIISPEINECSGMARADDSTFWVHNDDSDPNLYRINQNGKLKQTLALNPAISTADWEDIAQNASHLYIGNFGNNLNRRKNLSIFMLNPKFPQQIDSISFSYEDQKSFPPASPSQMNFDCEAMFYYKEKLYLFSKNKWSDTVQIYFLDTKPGLQKTKKCGSIVLSGEVTAADIHPEKAEFCLLTYGRIYFFSIDALLKQHQKARQSLNIFQGRQCESILYLNQNQLLVSNENNALWLVRKK